MSNNNEKGYCKMQPDNMGICCNEPEDSKKCRRCGWNPEEAQRRRNETLRKIRESEVSE